MSLWAVIPAAGKGLRLGGVCKALAPLGTRPMIYHACLALARNDRVDGLVVTASAEDLRLVREALGELADLKRLRVVEGGSHRRDSVRAGLDCLESKTEEVLVHDGARPFLSNNLLNRLLDEALSGAAAVIPILPIYDTVKEVMEDKVVRTMDRSRLARVQTPQRFVYSDLMKAHAKSTLPGATDDAHLVEQAGGLVRTVPGDPSNFKITTQSDLLEARRLVSARPVS